METRRDLIVHDRRRTNLSECGRAVMAGYSTTPLPHKLGIKEGHRVGLIDAPAKFSRTLGSLPTGVELGAARNGIQYNVLSYFVIDHAKLEKRIAEVAKRIEPHGGLWIAWPKKASGVATHVNENTIRAVALAAGLVDNKVCAIDETWSGLRCVVRVKDRPKSPKRQSAMPDQLATALAKSPKAKAAFGAMPPSHRREWITYVEEAKRADTRERRANQAVLRILRGKA